MQLNWAVLASDLVLKDVLHALIWQVVNAFALMVPPSNSTYGLSVTGWSAFAGGSLFEVGGVLMVLEVCFGYPYNKQGLSFGWSVPRTTCPCSRHAFEAQQHARTFVAWGLPAAARCIYAWHGHGCCRQCLLLLADSCVGSLA